MNLEQIDTITTAGKAEVMRLAAEGRKVAQRTFPNKAWTQQLYPYWNWGATEYAIIAEPVGPDEIYVVVESNGKTLFARATLEGVQRYAESHGRSVVQYIRADLAGEVK